MNFARVDSLPLDVNLTSVTMRKPGKTNEAQRYWNPIAMNNNFLKGIPHSIPLELMLYRDVLYNDERHKIQISTLRKDKMYKMSRFTQEKIGLSDIYVKHHVAEDKITCSPIQINGKYIYRRVFLYSECSRGLYLKTSVLF